MKTITKKEWKKIASFNKHIGMDGTYYITKLNNEGTALIPVKIEGSK